MTNLAVTRDTVVSDRDERRAPPLAHREPGFNMQKNSELNLEHAYSAPGQTWRFQRVQFPPRQEMSHPPGIESWAHGGNDMS